MLHGHLVFSNYLRVQFLCLHSCNGLIIFFRIISVLELVNYSLFPTLISVQGFLNNNWQYLYEFQQYILKVCFIKNILVFLMIAFQNI